jgi:hypothetical protein
LVAESATNRHKSASHCALGSQSLLNNGSTMPESDKNRRVQDQGDALWKPRPTRGVATSKSLCFAPNHDCVEHRRREQQRCADYTGRAKHEHRRTKPAPARGTFAKLC